MTNDELTRRLKHWTAPPRPRNLDDRILDDYRALRLRTSWWHAFFTASVRVPLPLAAAVLLLAVVSTFLAARRAPTGAPTPAVAAPATPRPGADDAVAATAVDLAGYEAATEIKVTILAPGGRR